MKQSKILLVFIILVIIVGVAYALNTIFSPKTVSEQTSNQVPSITEAIELKDFKIIVETPFIDEVVTSPLNISGKARGGWFFEATFPVVLTDENGSTIAEGFAKTDGDWMTEELVPFTASLEFEAPDSVESGKLIFKKANPSGLPENDEAHEVGVKFKTELEE